MTNALAPSAAFHVPVGEAGTIAAPLLSTQSSTHPRHLGVTDIAMPASPNRVRAAIQSSRSVTA